MADRGPRDRAIERMLRHGAVPHRSVAPGACIDGETLAAWSSGALGTAEAARVETHLADCARCQSVLAAFVRTEPIAAAPAPWWTRAHARWLVPLATAATVAAIWVAVPQRDEPASPSTRFFDPPEVESSARPDQPAPGANPDRRALQSSPAPDANAETPPRAVQPGASPRQPAAAQPERKEADALRQERRPDDPVQPAPKQESQERRAEEAGAGARARERAAAEPAPAAPPPPSSPAPAPARPAESPADVSEQRPLFRSPGTEIMSPGGSVRWRIVDGKVERSTTQGDSWEPVALPSAAAIAAGHSPAAPVMWLAGKAGTIFVTVNGSDFQRVSFVTAADLVSVIALDDRQATVTAADGRRFRTTDRGLNWSLQP